MKFFFDTADTEYIKKAWDKLKSDVSPQAVVGVTSNPNAFSKVNRTTIAAWQEGARQLCELITSIRNDDQGVVYVQMPHSSMGPKDALEWAKRIREWTDGKTRIGMKIPPFVNILEMAKELSRYADVNVTGVTDCATALRAFSYGVRYVSFLNGRMEEAGIDAKSQVAFANHSERKGGEIITASMRTIDGLKWCCVYDTVPTIGTRVWDAIFETLTPKDFVGFWAAPEKVPDQHFAPHIDQGMTDLSTAFFEQMDALGKPVRDEIAAS